MEDEETGDRFLVYASDKAARLEIRFQGETLWMTQAQIADLFGRDRTVITKHISNILEEAELDEASSVQKLHTTQGRPATIYNLDMVISVGYRVSSAQATLFRRWATGVLVQYAKKGFVVDTALKREGLCQTNRQTTRSAGHRGNMADEFRMIPPIGQSVSQALRYHG